MKTHILRFKKISILTASLCLLFVSLSFAAVPRLINYQGRLTDSSGTPLNGSYAITFRIYDAETAGSMLWEETNSGVVIQKGIFSVLLGSVTNLNLAFDKPYFLEIKVGAEVMSPRQRITGAGYAVRAETAESAIQAQNADAVGNVGVSATPTANKLLPLDSNAKLPLSALKTYDSGWFAVTVGTSYSKTHNLGTTKVLTLFYFSANSDGSGFVSILGDENINYNVGAYGTSMSALTTTSVTVRTANGGIFNGPDASGGNYYPSSGYLRIIMLALE